MSSSTPRKFVYKIVASAPSADLPEHLPLSLRDQKDGFVHLSTAQQVPSTCDAFFGTASTLWVFKLTLDRLSESMKWEGGYPHLYGTLRKEDVVTVRRMERAGGQNWVTVMSQATWLE
ncbi:hypothetical protein E4U09_002260 [Claviceps aff. purpurea]|uniref:DUF952 domain-containing protein n=1 Tax=Claviceps aff. purpurea TaxID=1967640 RepID=A0A9P7QPJ4_9HYPO|nr:hypothetical protein E4U23_006948 [Claviceps purpurea]KAG6303992.1 hypothetical protein E4U09_002260 [Claviceps aff. purpurea]